MAVVIDVVEDQRLIRELLADALTSDVRICVRGVFASAEEAWERWKSDPPQAAIVDIAMPGMNGVQLGVRCKRRHPSVGIILLSSYSYSALLDRLPIDVATGWGYLLKDDVDVDVILTAVQAAIEARNYLDPQLSTKTLAKSSQVHDLTERQVLMLKLIASGMSNAAIGEELHLTRKSVENAINRLYSALELDADDSETNRRVAASRMASSIVDIPR